MVTASGLGLRFGAQVLLEDAQLVVGVGDELALTGRSGSGKTTLLLTLAGLVPPNTGVVTWPGLASEPRQRRAEIGLVFQAPSLLPELTAAENVSLPLRLRGESRDASRTTTDAALRTIGLANYADALPHQLSGGMQQRVAVARALAGAPRLILADEPTGALDRRNAFTVLNAMRSAVAASGATLIIATHDAEIAAELTARLVISEGRLERERA